MKKRVLLLAVLLGLLMGCSARQEDPRVIVALLDTGVSTTALGETQILPGYNYVIDNADTEDRMNHGTAVAGVILGCDSLDMKGIAPDAYVVPLVVQDKDAGSVSSKVLARAIRDAVDRYNADIINISLGIKADKKEIRSAIAYAEAQGVLVVAAVGNSGESADLYYPAAYETVVAVGSHDKHGELSDFSQRNGTVDVLAPGEDVWFVAASGARYGSKGTSYATGFVSGIAARILQAMPGLGPEALRTRLFGAAIDVGDSGWDEETGWGILPAPAEEP